MTGSQHSSSSSIGDKPSQIQQQHSHGSQDVDELRKKAIKNSFDRKSPSRSPPCSPARSTTGQQPSMADLNPLTGTVIPNPQQEKSLERSAAAENTGDLSLPQTLEQSEHEKPRDVNIIPKILSFPSRKLENAQLSKHSSSSFSGNRAHHHPHHHHHHHHTNSTTLCNGSSSASSYVYHTPRNLARRKCHTKPANTSSSAASEIGLPPYKPSTSSHNEDTQSMVELNYRPTFKATVHLEPIHQLYEPNLPLPPPPPPSAQNYQPKHWSESSYQEVNITPNRHQQMQNPNRRNLANTTMTSGTDTLSCDQLLLKFSATDCSSNGRTDTTHHHSGGYLQVVPTTQLQGVQISRTCSGSNPNLLRTSKHYRKVQIPRQLGESGPNSHQAAVGRVRSNGSLSSRHFSMNSAVNHRAFRLYVPQGKKIESLV